MCSDCANSVGSRVAPSRSSIAGRRDASERYAEIAAEFVRLKVDVIVTTGIAVAIAAKQATSVIPIVFAVAADPVGSGLVASLARPGGNVTGLSIQPTDLAGKRLELLREVVPGLRRLAIMANVGNPAAVLEMGEVQAAARTLGLEVAPLEIRRAEDIAPAFEALKGRADALYVCGRSARYHQPDSHQHLGARARDCRRCSMLAEYVEAGGLMSYGPNFPDLFRRAADYVDKILRGAKPGRHSGRAADQVRSRHQSHDRQGARPRRAADRCSPAPTR